MAYKSEGPELMDVLMAPLYLAAIAVVLTVALVAAAYDRANERFKRMFGKGNE